MADYVTLLGAEQVQSAGHCMARAAEDMQQASYSISESVDRLTRALDEHASRIEAAQQANGDGRRLIGWRMADYTAETSDPATAKNWSANVPVLPIFEGDPNTKIGFTLETSHG
ncbi:MAG: hypothetical protein GAK28_00574 [Luteibacter sp.]|uniref:hypothetical protein n=1 Tax=Luteibacter sp. TaxID=1886636 RepID=UPI001384242D|nr:hypothetical protein [Luteibacter sp.]KAF1008942.1 MAG: hypothetical protein GAK28_00574 [Luteibacter sp.]